MIDIHCHILHNIDDGPKDIEASLALCEMAYGNGIEKLIATPHCECMADFNEFLQIRDARIEELRGETQKRGIFIDIYAGAEVFVNDDIFFAAALDKAALNAGRYLLVEFDFYNVSISRILKYTEEIIKTGLVPIIAHAERFTFFQEDYEVINFIADRGALFQINAGSLAGFGNREEFRLAYELALKNVASFIATDAHSFGRPNDMLRMVRSFPPDISPRNLNRMLYTAPQAVIDNQDLPDSVRGMVKRRRKY